MSGWHDWHEGLASGRGGVFSSAARGALWGVSKLYGVAIDARNGAFDRTTGRTRSVGVPVVSVGNITTGGTGKTPMVIELARRLVALGCKPAVVSRGYKSQPTAGSDEVTMMQRALPELLCVVDADRVAGAERAIREGADVILLDDGFQHRRLARDLDIVLIDATRPFGYGHLLPRGHLREPVESVRRADAIVLTRAEEVSEQRRVELLGALRELSPDASLLICTHRTESLEPLDESTTPVVAEDSSALLASGIANPQSFERSVGKLGIEILGHVKFPDHYAFRESDVAAIQDEASRTGAQRIIVTAKDATKLARLNASWPVPAFVLTVKIEFLDDSCEQMNKLLQRAIERKAQDG